MGNPTDSETNMAQYGTDADAPDGEKGACTPETTEETTATEAKPAE